MRLRPPALDRPCDAGPRPGLRSAPGYSCGYDLRPSIARAMADRARASGLRLATHGASIGAEGLVMRPLSVRPAPPDPVLPEVSEKAGFRAQPAPARPWFRARGK